MFEHLLEKIALKLDEYGILYMVIGGQAVLVHGEPRLTRDIDITLGVSLDRLPEVLTLAGEAGLTPLVDAETFTRQTMVLPCQEPETGIRVDFIFSFSPYEHQAIARARIIPIGAAQVRFASPEDLIIHKVLAGRPRDLEDVKSILLKNPAIDLDYIRQWLAEFAEATGEPLMERFDLLLKGIG